MDFIAQEIIDYAAQHTSEEPSLLAQLNRETWEKVLYPRMLSGHIQGRILSFLSQMMQPSRVLEIGTYTGYSAICLAEGLAEGGKVTTIDIDPELSVYIQKYIEATGNTQRIETLIGNATEIIPTLEEVFDLVFIDADKENYCTYYELVFPKLRKGGVILADNVLWSGKVLDNTIKDKETTAIRAFNRMVSEDGRVEQVLLPVRDGIMMIRKR